MILTEVFVIVGKDFHKLAFPVKNFPCGLTMTMIGLRFGREIFLVILVLVLIGEVAVEEKSFKDFQTSLARYLPTLESCHRTIFIYL